jgi:hypothetical protein
LRSHELREVMRQRDPRERQLLAHVHRGDPTNYITEKHNRQQLRIFAGDIESARTGERAAIAAWRDRQAACPWGQAVLIARDNNRRERLNTLVRTELQRDGRLGDSIHVAGHEFAVGDRVVARHNDRLLAVDNGTRGTVTAVDPIEKDVVVRTDAGARRALDAAYVAEHLQHAYALTAHSIQGGTVEWAGVVGRPEDFTRNWSYTALSRAREPTELFLIDTATENELDRAEIAPGKPPDLDDPRLPLERLDAAMRRRDDEDLALDRIDAERTRGPVEREAGGAGLPAGTDLARRSAAGLRTELAQLHERIGGYPEHAADQLHAARSTRAEAQRVADAARQHIAELEQPAGGALRRRPADRAALALERQRLQLAEDHVAAAAARERDLAGRVPRPRGMGGRTPLAPRARRRARRPAVKAPPSARARRARRPGPHLSTALGALPDKPHARRTWQQAAARIEAYRFDHAVTDVRDALGPPPSDTRERAHWQRARHDVQRAQRDLGQRIDRRHSREV